MQSVHSDVYIDVPDIIDISHIRSNGLQPGEELLPEGGMRSFWHFQVLLNFFTKIIYIFKLYLHV